MFHEFHLRVLLNGTLHATAHDYFLAGSQVAVYKKSYELLTIFIWVGVPYGECDQDILSWIFEVKAPVT